MAGEGRPETPTRAPSSALDDGRQEEEREIIMKDYLTSWAFVLAVVVVIVCVDMAEDMVEWLWRTLCC